MNASWSDNASEAEVGPVKPIADPSMPVVRLVCEVAINLPVAALGVLANALTFVVLCREKKRLTTDVLLQVLAVADTLILISSILLRSMRYVGWQAYNDVYHYIFVSLYPCVYFFRLADTWITVVMTVDRYIAVCHPLQAQRLCTLRRTYVIIGVILSATFVFSVPRFFEFRLIDVTVSSAGFVHTSLVSNRTYTLAYRIVLFFVVMYLVPMSVLIVLNVRLLYSLRRACIKRGSMLSNSSVGPSVGDGVDAALSSRSATLTVVTIVIICVVCNVTTMTTHVFWILHVCFSWLRHLERKRRFLANVSNVLVTVNSTVNFVVYCMFCRKFRLGLRRALRCRRLPDFSHTRLSATRSQNGNGSYLMVVRWKGRA